MKLLRVIPSHLFLIHRDCLGFGLEHAPSNSLFSSFLKEYTYIEGLKGQNDQKVAFFFFLEELLNFLSTPFKENCVNFYSIKSV